MAKSFKFTLILLLISGWFFNYPQINFDGHGRLEFWKGPPRAEAASATIVPASKHSLNESAELLSEITSDNATCNPDTVSAETAGDGCYTVDAGNTIDLMYLGSFDALSIPGGASISAATLQVEYGTEDGYDGTACIRYNNGAGLTNTTICINSDVANWNTATYDLFAAGVDTKTELANLDIEFFNGDGGGADSVSFDYLRIAITYTDIRPNPPSLDSPTNSATGVSVTPTFLMTATDPQTDNLGYKVKIHSGPIGTDLNLLQEHEQAADSTGWSGTNASCTRQPTSCYTSGTQASFTLQSGDALQNSTQYWWQTAARDPDNWGDKKEQGLETVFNSGTSNYTSITALSSTKLAVAYRDASNSDYGTGVIGDVSGTVITFGSEYVFNSGISYYTSITALSSTKLAVAYRDGSNSNYGTGVIGDVSGTVITFGSEYVFNSGISNDTSITALSSTKLAVAYRDTGNSSYGTGVIGDVSGTVITFGPEYVFNSGTSNYTSITALSSTKMAVAYQDASNSNYGTGVIMRSDADDGYIYSDSLNTFTTTAGGAASLTFVVSTNTFPGITPGTAVFATTTLSVDTDNSTGWNVTVSRDDADTTMDLADATVNITDQTAWVPGVATTTAGNAVRISSLDSSGDVLAMRVMTASGTQAFKSTSWWGTTDAYIDSATTLWAGFNFTAKKIGDSSVSCSGANCALNTVLYYLDVPSTQKTGAYSGGITYTATMNP